MWVEQITKPALNQVGINNFNYCVVLAIKLIVLVCFTAEQRLFLSVWSTIERCFIKVCRLKQLTDYCILIISTHVTKQLKYLGSMEVIFKVTGCIDVLLNC